MSLLECVVLGVEVGFVLWVALVILLALLYLGISVAELVCRWKQK